MCIIIYVYSMCTMLFDVELSLQRCDASYANVNGIIEVQLQHRAKDLVESRCISMGHTRSPGEGEEATVQCFSGFV